MQGAVHSICGTKLLFCARAMDSDSSDDEYWGSYERLPQARDQSVETCRDS